MTELLLKWLTDNPSATNVLIIVFVVLAVAVVLTFLIAVFEGREISFYPPKIGGRTEVYRRGRFSKFPSNKLENELREIFTFSGTVVWSRSFETNKGKKYLRAPDARASSRIMAFQKGTIKHYDEDSGEYNNFSIDRPADHLIVIGSIRYNKHAEQIQKHFDMPFEYIFASYGDDPGNRIIRIVTEHGEELSSSRDHTPTLTESGGVDYGILFLGNLSNNKKIYWVGGIHGIGTDGVFQYLTENAKQIRDMLNNDENTGLCWLLRIQYETKENGNSEVTNVECLGNPKQCNVHVKSKPAHEVALIFDLGNVIMHFDRSRTYRAIGHLLGKPFTEIEKRIENTDLLQRYEVGKLTDDEFRSELYSVIGDNEKQLSPSILDELWGDIFWPNNEMLEALRCLKLQGIKLLLLSNTNNIHFQRVRSDYPEIISLFDKVILSFEEKKYKPDYQLFSSAIQKTQELFSEKPDILFIDDNEQFVKTANQLGMKGFTFRSYSHFVFWLRKMGVYIP